MKQSIPDLAVFGGEPTFKSELHVGRPNMGNREQFLERVNDILDRRWFTNNGRYVQEFEQRIADMVGIGNCVAMCNATIALEIAIRALELKGEVIVPSFTFVATAHALQWQEITPVFCDIAPTSHHIDPARIEAMLTPRTTGIIAVHVWGEACDIDGLQTIADKYNLRLLYDAAHAIGSSYNGKMLGSFGDAEVFSFHATKFLNAFEGGAVLTNNDELADRMRYMRNFGFDGLDKVSYLGINGKMSEISAAMGITSLDSIDDMIATNKRNYHCYQHHLDGIKGVELYHYNENEKRNYQYVILEIDETQTGIDRDTMVTILHKENILARRYFYPGCHQMEPYRSYFPHAGLMLPRTEKLTLKVMSLPTGTAINEVDIKRICDLIRFMTHNGVTIAEKLHTI
jgi:dTDP-4-amino-4,6-dideoxygalactose transaminase